MKGSTQQLILAVLNHQDLYGYEIIKKIASQSEEVLILGEGSVYPMLHQLEEKKYITSYWRNENGRNRKYYSIAKSGRKMWVKNVQEWRLFSQSVNKVFQLT